jgi:hypothetical protein
VLSGAFDGAEAAARDLPAWAYVALVLYVLTTLGIVVWRVFRL